MHYTRGCSSPFVVIALVVMNISVSVDGFSQPSLPLGISHGTDFPTKGTPYEIESYVSNYETVLKKVLDSGKTRSKKDSEEDYEAVKRFLFLKNRSVEIHISSLMPGKSCIEDDKEEYNASLKETLKVELSTQRERAAAKLSFTPSQLDLTMRSLSYLGDFCAKRISIASASEVLQSYNAIIVGWDKMKELGLLPRQNTVSAYHFVLSTRRIEYI